MIVERVGDAENGAPRYRISIALFYFPGRYAQFGLENFVPRMSNPIGRAIARWLERAA